MLQIKEYVSATIVAPCAAATSATWLRQSETSNWNSQLEMIVELISFEIKSPLNLQLNGATVKFARRLFKIVNNADCIIRLTGVKRNGEKTQQGKKRN